MMQLDPDFREFVESFNDHEVRCLVVGGYALSAHGLPREVIGRDGLVRNKIAADRPQDSADVARLRRQDPGA